MVVDFGNGVGRWGGEVGPPPTYPKTTTENSDANGGNEEGGKLPTGVWGLFGPFHFCVFRFKNSLPTHGCHPLIHFFF